MKVLKRELRENRTRGTGLSPATRNHIHYPKLCLTAITALGCSLILAYVLVLTLSLFFADGLNSQFEDFDQIFVRAFLTVAVVTLTLIAIRWGLMRHFYEHGRWAKVLTYAVGLGMASAVLDPSSSIDRENNVIRYWTSGLLVWAALALFFASRTSHLPAYQRVAVAFLGFLVMLGAIDEIFQFHEFLGDTVITDTPDALRVDSQDFITLFVALVGFVGSVVGLAAIHASERFLGLKLARGIRKSAMLFISACIVFLVAMMLDTYDHYLENFVNNVIAAVLETDSSILEFTEKHEFIIRLSNCLEEFLELMTAAILVCCGMVLLQEQNLTGSSA